MEINSCTVNALFLEVPKQPSLDQVIIKTSHADQKKTLERIQYTQHELDENSLSRRALHPWPLNTSSIYVHIPPIQYPDTFICPVTLELMNCPCIPVPLYSRTEDTGHAYEKKALETIIYNVSLDSVTSMESVSSTSAPIEPLSRKPFKGYVFNRNLKDEIDRFKLQFKDSFRPIITINTIPNLEKAHAHLVCVDYLYSKHMYSEPEQTCKAALQYTDKYKIYERYVHYLHLCAPTITYIRAIGVLIELYKKNNQLVKSEEATQYVVATIPIILDATQSNNFENICVLELLIETCEALNLTQEIQMCTSHLEAITYPQMSTHTTAAQPIDYHHEVMMGTEVYDFSELGWSGFTDTLRPVTDAIRNRWSEMRRYASNILS